MNLVNVAADLMPEWGRRVFDVVLARINTVWAKEHNPETGAHDFPHTQTTVGAAGSASALPANPTGYVLVVIDGTERAIPFYAKS